jgi:hypothetical protein
MVVATRSAQRLAELRDIFPEGADVPRQRPNVSLTAQQGSYWFWLTRVLPVHASVTLERWSGMRPLRS